MLNPAAQFSLYRLSAIQAWTPRTSVPRPPSNSTGLSGPGPYSLGFRFYLTKPITVSKLGHLALSGESSSNRGVKLWDNSNTAVAIASGTVLAATSPDALGFKSVSITPVSLIANKSYTLAQEVLAGDSFIDNHSVIGQLDAVVNAFMSCYTTTAGNYPGSDVSAGEFAYGCPAMWFVNEPLSYAELLDAAGAATGKFVPVYSSIGIP